MQEAGEAKENFDLRTIFDNTCVLAASRPSDHLVSKAHADGQLGTAPTDRCSVSTAIFPEKNGELRLTTPSTLVDNVRLLRDIIWLSWPHHNLYKSEKELTPSTILRLANRSRDGSHQASSPSPTP